MNKKVISSIIGVIVVIVALGAWYVSSPHQLSDQQVLQRFSWQMTQTDGIRLGTVKFTDKHIKINKQQYDYHYSDEVEDDQRPSDEGDDGQLVGTLIIDDGPYSGHYVLETNATNYNLIQQGRLKYTLMRKG